METRKAVALQLGWKVFAGLIALTILEFWVASVAYGPLPYPVLCGLLAPITWISVSAAANPLPYLGVIALLKAGLIVQYWGVEASIKYWHFVHLVWVFFHPALYLVV